MERTPIEVCSFCRTRDTLGFRSTDGSTGICERCVSDMQTAIRHTTNSSDSIGDLFDEWMLFVFPLAIVLVSISVQPASVNRPWSPLLQAFGVVFLLGGLFYQLWSTIARRRWRPSPVVPFVWVGCGAYIGFPAGVVGTVAGAVLGLGIWIFSRRFITRVKLRRLLEGAGRSATRH